MDMFVVNIGLNVRDKIVLEGVRQVEEGGGWNTSFVSR
jgi:hypothetical protein